MFAFRISKAVHDHDLTGAGARAHGGRWNRKGTAMLYTSATRALAVAEYLVHLEASNAPADLSLLALDLPDDLVTEELDPDTLPAHWRSYPAPPELADLGERWAAARRSLVLFVPSVVVPPEKNILLNPSHGEMPRVRLVEVVPFAFDPRLMGSVGRPGAG